MGFAKAGLVGALVPPPPRLPHQRLQARSTRCCDWVGSRALCMDRCVWPGGLLLVEVQTCLQATAALQLDLHLCTDAFLLPGPLPVTYLSHWLAATVQRLYCPPRDTPGSGGWGVRGEDWTPSCT